MFRSITISTLATLFLTTAAFAATEPTVKEVVVTVELAAIENVKAAAYWTTISDDLANAIVARVTDQISDDGISVTIDLEEVSLSNGFEAENGLAETRLVGNVTFSHATDNSRFDGFDLMVDVNAARTFIPADVDVITLQPDSRVYYEAMIATFAQGVVDRLK